MPGDTVYFREGSYIVPQDGGITHPIGSSGTAENPITIKAANDWKALITENTTPEENTGVVTISNSSYLIFEGFEISKKCTIQ